MEKFWYQLTQVHLENGYEDPEAPSLCPNCHTVKVTQLESVQVPHYAYIAQTRFIDIH